MRIPCGRPSLPTALSVYNLTHQNLCVFVPLWFNLASFLSCISPVSRLLALESKLSQAGSRLTHVAVAVEGATMLRSSLVKLGQAWSNLKKYFRTKPRPPGNSFPLIQLVASNRPKSPQKIMNAPIPAHSALRPTRKSLVAPQRSEGGYIVNRKFTPIPPNPTKSQRTTTRQSTLQPPKNQVGFALDAVNRHFIMCKQSGIGWFSQRAKSRRQRSFRLFCSPEPVPTPRS